MDRGPVGNVVEDALEQASGMPRAGRSFRQRHPLWYFHDAERKGYAGKTIGLKLRYDNFKTVTRDETIEAPTQDAHVIRRAVSDCLKRVTLDRRIRLLGVRIGSLSPCSHADPLREQEGEE